MNNHHSIEGLSSREANMRLQQEGGNVLAGSGRRSILTVALKTLKEPMFGLLLFAGVLYMVLGQTHEGFFLFMMVLFTLGLTLFQEGKAERALDALRDISVPQVTVIRDGVQKKIDSRHLVRGDILIIAEGDRIAADCILLTDNGMQVNESLLTGESVAVLKKPADSGAETDEQTDALLFSGTFVVQGSGVARVMHTGMQTQLGKIGQSLQHITTETSPLQQKIMRLVQLFSLVGSLLAIVLALIYGLARDDWLQGLLAGIAFAMAMLPEEFPVIFAIFPALGAWKLARARVLTRRISCIETLGSASVLCTDKTGTLTENKMSVARLHADNTTIVLSGHPGDSLTLPHLTLLHHAVLACPEVSADPMETAIVSAGDAYFPTDRHHALSLLHTYPLTTELRVMSQIWQDADSSQYVVAAKGAPEAILSMCHLADDMRRQLLGTVDEMAKRGLRTLGVARAEFAEAPWPVSQRGFSFRFLGLIGLEDPLRQDIRAAMHTFNDAGIRVIMMTGDHPETANAIAMQAGARPGVMMTGYMLGALSDAELNERVKSVAVWARIKPEQKLRIVQALKAQGEIVAMIGDGVNDAPALKAAHVGIAMGQRGTQVARESASLVLLDDRFSSVVDAIRIGRTIFNNMRKAMAYVIAIHMPIAGMAFLPVLLGWPVMLYPMHIVFLEMIIDPACSLVFEAEPAEPDVMQRAPRRREAPMLEMRDAALAFLRGAVVLLAAAGTYRIAHAYLADAEARAYCFTLLIGANIALIVSIRAARESLWRSLARPNRILWIMCGVALMLLLLVTRQSDLLQIFHFAQLSVLQMTSALALGAASVFWFDIFKRPDVRDKDTAAATAISITR